MARRLSHVIFLLVFICLPVIYLLFRRHLWIKTTIGEPHTWKNLNGLSMKRCNELFMECCQAVRLPQPCLPYCKYNEDNTVEWSLSDVQDHNSCDLIENFELLFKCANGMHKQSDSRPCCLEHGAITSKNVDEDTCAQFCHPHQLDGISLRPGSVLCLTKLKIIGYCHFINLADKS